MERNLVADYVEVLLQDLRPKLNEVLAAHPIPEGLSSSELVEVVLALQTKGAFDFAHTQAVTALEFSLMLRNMAEKLENEFLEEMHRISADMEPTNIEELLQDAVQAEEKLDNEIQQALSNSEGNG